MYPKPMSSLLFPIFNQQQNHQQRPLLISFQFWVVRRHFQTARKRRNTAVSFRLYGFINRSLVSDTGTFISVSCRRCVSVGYMDFQLKTEALRWAAQVQNREGLQVRHVSPSAGRLDMTFMVDWALKTNDLSPSVRVPEFYNLADLSYVGVNSKFLWVKLVLVARTNLSTHPAMSELAQE